MQKLTGAILVVAAVLALLVLAMFQLPLKDRSAFVPPPSNPREVTVLTLGDYGEGDYRQRRVAGLLEQACRSGGGETLVQTLGDNFYPDGVSDIDDPQWQSKFEAIYDTPCLLGTDFFAALGNHDYGGSIEAQVRYQGQGSGRWKMPATYYIHDHGSVDGHPLVRVVVLDTMADLEDQIAMINDAFRAPDAATWRVVVGHFNVRTFSLKYHDNDDMQRKLLPTLLANRVHFYLSGHSHNLQLIDAPVDPNAGSREPIYVIAGGGGASPREMVAADPQIARLIRQGLGFAAITFTPETARIRFTDTSGEFLTTFAVDTRSFVVDRACLQTTRLDSCVSSLANTD